MKYTVFGKMDDKDSFVTWEDGKLSGDPLAVALVTGEARAEEGHPVGPAAGPYTEKNHLANPLSAYCLIEQAAFVVQRHEGDTIPCPTEQVSIKKSDRPGNTLKSRLEE